MNELVGKECGCEFDIPSTQWPISGFPAWVIVEAVDMPMVKLRSKWGRDAFWINASKIERIWERQG